MATAMFRTSTPRLILKGLQTAPRVPITNAALRATLKTSTKSLKRSPVVSLALRSPVQKALVRYQSQTTFIAVADKDAEARYGKEKIAAHPEIVSTDSSVHPALQGEVGSEPDKDTDVDMMAGIRSDFNTILETFTLKDVPKEALYVGLAGVVPYLLTSLSTVYLSFDIQYAANHGQGLLISGEMAEAMLHIIEPIQLGYGASIISFLGAIHWGLEWGNYGGHQGYPRYSIGIIATAVAWPTLLFSAEVGLIAQFLAFTFLYYADARASVRGWAPPWYATYRFVLTFIVGASIVASLIGRGQIADLITSPSGPAQRMKELREVQLRQLEEDDAENKARAEAEEGGDDDKAEEDDEE